MAEKTVRVLVGTRKGTYIVQSNAARKSWKVGPVSNAGREIYHVSPDPRHPGALYAAVNSGFWGPILYRSSNWGKTWQEATTPLTPRAKERTPSFDPDNPLAPVPRPVQNLWHIEPGHESEPQTLFVGVDPHLLFRSDDLAKSWTPVTGINEHPSRPKWGPGAGGACLHTVIIDPRDRRRMHVGISAAGTFRSDDGGEHWRPTNEKVNAPFNPDPYPELGQCVHHVALDAADPDVAYRQDHGGIYVNRRSMDGPWDRIGKVRGGPKDDFGFAVASAASRPGRAYFVPLTGEARTTPSGGLQVWEWTDRSRSWRVLMSPRQFPGEFGVHREGMACDALDPAGIYVGTTTGQLVLSPDAGRTWRQVPYQFPGIHSVAVAP
ncbi:MAG TPA: exo-alpha-sialidase [Thermoplasmata archaeon]|nr:exo-alpha-sialidase [Thermoplasmata archaeon]